MKLYEITELIKKSEELELTQDDLELLEIELKQKSDNIVKYINNLESNINVIDTEIKRLQELKKTEKNKLDNLKEYIKYCLNKMNVKKIDSTLGKITIRKSESVEIEDIEKIPGEFVTIKQTFNPDKTAIKKAIKEGREIPGAKIIIKENINIK
jgi:uncharacterized protein YdhG (YjbR/CyaY superfamily)